jgi:uncharacterized protein (TIGR04255 family)
MSAMDTDEVYTNPTVKQVIFQIKFPSLFYIETKVGEFQLRIMKEFPKSEAVVQKQLVFAEVKQGEKVEPVPDLGTGKIWKFISESGTELQVRNDSVTLSSEHHSSYASGELGQQFREVIHFAITQFLDTVQVPVLTRIGLRYVDYCPVTSMRNTSFNRFYNSCLPVKRFPLDSMSSAAVTVITSLADGFGLIYKEQLVVEDRRLIVDIDAYHETSVPADYLTIADQLHQLTSNEFWRTAKEPLKNYMRKPAGGA